MSPDATADRATKARRVREALEAVTRPQSSDYAVQVRYPGQDPYILNDGLTETAAATIADSLNRNYGLGTVAFVVPRGADTSSTHGVS
jgi:alpha-beta hydrolase superfamily lysophospholipase